MGQFGMGNSRQRLSGIINKMSRPVIRMIFPAATVEPLIVV